jgi:S-DNA-T family DNA segregation ATPase FtsK/SpoIIIE
MGKNFKRRQALGEKIKEHSGFLSSLGEKRQLIEETVAIFLFGCALFLLLSLISYKGLSLEGLPGTDGWTGVAGGYMAFILFQLLGWTSYAVALLVGLSGLLLFLRRRRFLSPMRLSFSFLTLTLLSGCLHTLLLGKKVLGGHLAGGAVGLWLGDHLLPLFARTGTLLVLGTAVLILAVLVSGISTRRGLVLLWITIRYLARLMLEGLRRAAGLLARRRSEEEEYDDDEIEEPACEDEDPAAVEPLPPGDGERDIEKIIVSGEGDRRRQAPKPARRRILPGKASSFKLPPFELLKEPEAVGSGMSKDQMKSVDQKLVETLASYNIRGEVTAIHPGPVVTTYEFRPEKGTKIASIVSREDDITMSLEAHKVRIVAPIPGKNAVGFEIPNPTRNTVFLRELIQDPGFDRTRKKIPLSVGKDIIGRSFIADLDKMPHLLIAGTTGSGKSVSVNAMLMSMLYTFTPDELHLILIDPKQVEMQTYDGIPHLLLPVVTDPKKAALALKWAVDEMERRYQLFAGNGSKDLQSYNRKVRKELGEKPSKKDAEPETPQPAEGGPDSAAAPPQPPEPLPYVVIVIDELADLMMAAVRDVEWSVTRLAQKARAAGIHLIVATQRPSVNVVTGLIKANFPCRIAFRVASKVDSRVMLDKNGAETLLGDGDMLVLPPGTSDLVRIQGAFVSEDEIRNVATFLRDQGAPTYKEEILSGQLEDDLPLIDGEEADEYYDSCVNLVLSERKASVSYLQRRFSIGYNRAARIMERMEREGIVGPSVPGKPYREVLLQASP